MIKERKLNIMDVQHIQHEKEIILQRRKSTFKMYFLYNLIAFTIFFIAYYNMNISDHYGLIFCLCCFLFVDLWQFFESIKETKNNLTNILILEKGNTINFIPIKAKEFILIEEHEDEGEYYLFQVDENKMLYLGGQDFYEEDLFPNNDFEIVFAKDRKNEFIFFERYDLGEKIFPLKTISKKESVVFNEVQLKEINQNNLNMGICSEITGQICDIQTTISL